MKKKEVLFNSILVVFILGLIFWFAVSNKTLTGFTVFEDSGDFAGTFENTTLNGSAIVLQGNNLTGSYTSEVFDAGAEATWNNLSWASSGTSPVFFVRICDEALCSGEYWNQISLDSGSNFWLTNARYFQYKANFEIIAQGEVSSLTNIIIDYTLSNSAPNLTVVSPINGAVYGDNSSLNINLTVSDTELDTCWYQLDQEAQVFIPGCDLAPLSADEGNHTLTVFANDSSGLVSNKTILFTVQIDAPTLYLVSPESNAVINGSAIQVSFFVEDEDLDNCSFLSDFGGGWGTSSIDEPFSGGINSLASSATEGAHNWTFGCYDATAKGSVALQRRVLVDTVAPSLTLSQPSGTYTTKKNIPITLAVEDTSAVTCAYTLKRQESGNPVLVVVMPECESTSFNVDKNGQYVLEISVTDAGGNTETTENNFVVTSASEENNEGSGSGGGGGGSDFSINAPNLFEPKLEYDEPTQLSVRPGFSEKTSVTLINKGNRALNNCKINGDGLFSGWIESDSQFSLAPGESREYPFTLTIPREQAAGQTTVDIAAECDEISGVVPILVTVIPADFDFAFISYEIDGASLVVSYSLEDLTQEGSEVLVGYSLKNSKDLIKEIGEETISLAPGEIKDIHYRFDLPKDSFGELTLVFDLSTEGDALNLEEPIFLPSKGITGFAVSDSNKKTLKNAGLIVGILILVGIAVHLIRKFYDKKLDKKKSSPTTSGKN